MALQDTHARTGSGGTWMDAYRPTRLREILNKNIYIARATRERLFKCNGQITILATPLFILYLLTVR